ncbi:kell blood group glycoprotein isoform X2 [Denticeps clupeoides]|uniref:kell blood group glycoprotein isoform X2 n=1 Tax=Denticeps clupeoides TaxID=299321 RepID=UPI0010A51E70|nr:kell blood group glycoprotein-like isoform X2 [Denticeps clupeoides]
MEVPPVLETGEHRPCKWNWCCRLLMAAMAFCFIAMVIGFGIYTLWTPDTAPDPPECLSPVCLEAADRLSATVDPFSQPCDYFHFSCRSRVVSRGRQRGEITPYHGSDKVDTEDGKRNVRKRTFMETDILHDRQTLLLVSIRDILEIRDRTASPDSPEEKVRRFYHSCMNTDAVENLGSQPFLNLIQQLGGWPASGHWNRTDFNSTLIKLMNQFNTFPFFTVYVGRDQNSSLGSPSYIQIDQPEFQLPIEWDSISQTSKAKTESLRSFLTFSLQLFTLLGVPPKTKSMHNGLYIALSSELARAAMPLQYRLHNNMMYQRLTVHQLQQLAPAIDWLGSLKATFHPLPVNQSDLILVHNLPYLQHMSQTINKWLLRHEMMGSGPVHTFMMLSLLYTVIPALDSRFRETLRNQSFSQGKPEEEVPNWISCVLQTEKGFDTLLLHMVKERNTNREAEELVNTIHSAIQTKLADLSWRNKDFQSSILKKLRSLTPRLSTWNKMDKKKLTQLYSEVVIGENKYFTNYLQSLILQQRRWCRLLSEPVQFDIMSISPSVSGDDILFPIGMFTPPWFHRLYPRAVNYGLLGFLMAKDLLHLLLPDIHSYSDTPETVSVCVWSQYMSVTEGPGRVGTSVLSQSQKQEVWVQYTALQVALQAYLKSFQWCRNDSALFGLSHTHLFLTSFTQVSCDPIPHHELMAFEPSFLVSVICANSDLCPSWLACSTEQLQLSQASC